MSEFDRLKAQKDAISEREGLRNAQARRVMPLIGGLVDAWDGMYADDAIELEEMYPSLVRAIKVICSAQTKTPDVPFSEEFGSGPYLGE